MVRNSECAPLWCRAVVGVAVLGLIACDSVTDPKDTWPDLKDTCTNGLNMVDPRIVNGLEPGDPGPSLRITWDEGTERGRQLPEAYFAGVSPFTRFDPSSQLVVSAVLTGPRLIRVQLVDLTERLKTEDKLGHRDHCQRDQWMLRPFSSSACSKL